MRGPGGFRGSRRTEAGCAQGIAEPGFGESAGDATGPRGHVGASLLVHVRVGDHVGDRERPPGRSTRAASRSTSALSPHRHLTVVQTAPSAACLIQAYGARVNGG